MDHPWREFPMGEGPPLYVTSSAGGWRRLGLDEAGLVDFDGEGEGVFAWGMIRSRVVIWIREAPHEDVNAAYCYHAGPGPLRPQALDRAMDALRCEMWHRPEVYVIIAARGSVDPADESFLLSGGFRSDHVFTYSGSLTPQFGVSAKGCVGEPI